MTADRPSGLGSQSEWLVEAGLATADCYGLQAGHAISGGYRSLAGPLQPGPELTLEEALRAACYAIRAVQGAGME